MGDLEIWKPIEDYEGLYEVSSLGNVKSLKGHSNFEREKLLAKHYNDRDGQRYYCVTLYDRNGGRKTVKVHRLVAKAFIPNPNKLELINHKDENTLNNSVDNLEWCSRQYNICYRDAQLKGARKRQKKVIFKKDEKILFTFESVLDAGKHFGIKPQNIARAARGVRKTFHGMVVQYV